MTNPSGLAAFLAASLSAMGAAGVDSLPKRAPGLLPALQAGRAGWVYANRRCIRDKSELAGRDSWTRSGRKKSSLGSARLQFVTTPDAVVHAAATRIGWRVLTAVRAYSHVSVWPPSGAAWVVPAMVGTAPPAGARLLAGSPAGAAPAGGHHCQRASVSLCGARCTDSHAKFMPPPPCPAAALRVRVCVVPCLDGVQAADNSLAHAWDGVAAARAPSRNMLGAVRCESRLPAPQPRRR